MAKKINSCDSCGWVYVNKGSGPRMRKHCTNCNEDKQSEFEKKVMKQAKGEEL